MRIENLPYFSEDDAQPVFRHKSILKTRTPAYNTLPSFESTTDKNTVVVINCEAFNK